LVVGKKKGSLLSFPRVVLGGEEGKKPLSMKGKELYTTPGKIRRVSKGEKGKRRS